MADNERGLDLSHIWTIQLLSVNVKVYVRFIIFFQISFCVFFIDCYVGYFYFMFFVSICRGGVMLGRGGGGGGRGVFFWGWGMGGNMPYRTIKMEPANVQLVTYIDYGIEHNDKDLKFKGSDHAKEY